MANVKTLIKKLVNNGYSEDKLSMMTEKEIRDAYKIVKEEIIMKKNANTTKTIDNATTNKEESTMNKTNNTTATNNSTTTKKEVITMTNEMIKVLDTMNRTMQLVQVLEWCDTIKNVHDVCYVKKDVLAQFLFDKDLIGRQLSKKELKKITRDELIANLRSAVENLTKANVITPVTPVAEVVSVGDLSITSDRIYYDDTIIEKAVNPTPDDAKALTYRLMHKIGDHAINNRKKGFGTTVSAWMLCAYILEVKYGMTHLKGHEHEVTDEMKETVKNVRKWLIDNGYIKTVTFKDEKGFVFYTPEYDGNRKDKMYDCTKFQATGKVETTTYRVTKEMNKWYK